MVNEIVRIKCFVLLLLAGLVACEKASTPVSEVPPEPRRDTIVVVTLQPLLDSVRARIPEAILKKCPPEARFDFPVGPPDAYNYYKFRGFQGIKHLGEDWNGTGGGNTDFGDYVYAAGDGVVWHARNLFGGWGNVIRMVHNIGTSESPQYVETVYAHVASMWGRIGNRFKRGEIIGTIGSANGRYHAHLHFEVRMDPGKHIRAGYDGDTAGFVDPTKFIEQYRAPRARTQKGRKKEATWKSGK